jgi:hypothetical protein
MRRGGILIVQSEARIRQVDVSWNFLLCVLRGERSMQYNVNPPLCLKYLVSIEIISFIEDEEAISKILKHLEKEHGNSRDESVQNWPNMV